MGFGDLGGIPLPQRTETDSTTASDLATDVSTSKPDAQESKSAFSIPDDGLSIPDDGSPLVVKTRRSNNRSQSLLIEYYEGISGSAGAGTSSGTESRPSVRVRLTPSKSRRDD